MSSVARPSRALAAVAVVALLCGCGGAGVRSDDGRQVAASFYPLAWVAGEVAGDGWTVTNLTTPGGEPHDLELSIEGTAALARADLVVYLGGFQPAVDDSVETNAEGETLDVADVLDLVPSDEHVDEESHDHGDLDPHFWLDPLLVADVAGSVADHLAELDPERATTYRANADRLVSRLEQLDQQYADGLASCERDTVVVSHDAFGYLDRYGLRLESIAGLFPDAEPTPAVLAELGELIRREGITTVFSERLASPALAEALAHDLGVGTAVLDPIEGLTDETADEDYLTLMEGNLSALEEANGC